MTLLIDAGANVDARTFKGEAPLHWTAERGTATAVDVVFDAGADPRGRNAAGLLAFDLATENPEVVGKNPYCRLNDARLE